MSLAIWKAGGIISGQEAITCHGHSRAQESTESSPLACGSERRTPTPSEVCSLPRPDRTAMLLGSESALAHQALFTSDLRTSWWIHPDQWLQTSIVWYKMHLFLESMPFCYYNQLLMIKSHLEVPQIPHFSIYYVIHINSLSLSPKYVCACDLWHC